MANQVVALLLNEIATEQAIPPTLAEPRLERCATAVLPAKCIEQEPKAGLADRLADHREHPQDAAVVGRKGLIAGAPVGHG